MSTQVHKEPSIVNKYTIFLFSFILEIVLYAVIFIAIEAATLETAFKAATVLAIALRLFWKYLESKKT
jgi:heme/copper-type cytochrome/quinol oxidase subunit 4